MNLYITKDGQYAGTQKDAGKGHTAIEVPTDKAGLIAYLNGLVQCAKVEGINGEMKGRGLSFAVEAPESPVQGPQDDPAPRAYATPADDYQSPLTAKSVIAGIDAGMVSMAVRQFDGKNLAKVMTAGIERMAVLAREIAS